MLSRDELAAWLRLATTPGIGRGTARQLLSAFGSPPLMMTLCVAVSATLLLSLIHI